MTLAHSFVNEARRAVAVVALVVQEAHFRRTCNHTMTSQRWSNSYSVTPPTCVIGVLDKLLGNGEPVGVVAEERVEAMRERVALTEAERKAREILKRIDSV